MVQTYHTVPNNGNSLNGNSIPLCTAFPPPNHNPGYVLEVEVPLVQHLYQCEASPHLNFLAFSILNFLAPPVLNFLAFYYLNTFIATVKN